MLHPNAHTIEIRLGKAPDGRVVADGFGGTMHYMSRRDIGSLVQERKL